MKVAVCNFDFLHYFQQYVDDERFLYTDAAVSIDPVVGYIYTVVCMELLPLIFFA